MCLSGASCLTTDYCFSELHYKNPTVGLVQSRHHHHITEFDLFLLWYSWKIAHLALNNNHSLLMKQSSYFFNSGFKIYMNGRWIYNYLCNQCLSPLTLWVRIPFRRGTLDTTLCDKVCQRHTAGWWFSPGNPVSSTNKTDCHDITEILLKVALNTINVTPNLYPNTYEILTLFTKLVVNLWFCQVRP